MPSRGIFTPNAPAMGRLSSKELVDLLWSTKEKIVWTTLEHFFRLTTHIYNSEKIKARLWSSISGLAFQCIEHYPQLQLSDLRIEIFVSSEPNETNMFTSTLAVIVPTHPELEKRTPICSFTPKEFKSPDKSGFLCKTLFEFTIVHEFQQDAPIQTPIIAYTGVQLTD
jgi:hypothetical protein